MECDIKVVESLKEGRGIKVLLVDGKEESATFLGEDKYELVYPYCIEIFSILFSIILSLMESISIYL